MGVDTATKQQIVDMFKNNSGGSDTGSGVWNGRGNYSGGSITPRNDVMQQFQDKVPKHMEKFAKPEDYFPADFNATWLNYLRSGKVPDTELNRDLMRQMGVNNAGAKDTLKYSRLVDKLNNRHFISPADIGARGTKASGGGAVLANDAINYGNIYKMNGIETAESRAQKRNEGYESAVRQREIGRQQDVKDFGPQMARLTQLEAIARQRQLSTEEIRERAMIYDEMFRQNAKLPGDLQYAIALNRAIAMIAKVDVPLAMSSQIMQSLNTGRATDTAFAQLFADANGMTGLDAAQQMALAQMVKDGVDNNSIDSTMQWLSEQQQNVNQSGYTGQ
jgi:hypothetical protein